MAERWLDCGIFDVPPEGYRAGDKITRRVLCDLGTWHTVVASVGYGRDWAAYVGNGDDSPGHVAKQGDKVVAEVAAELFPGLALGSGRFYRS